MHNLKYSRQELIICLNSYFERKELSKRGINYNSAKMNREIAELLNILNGVFDVDVIRSHRSVENKLQNFMFLDPEKSNKGSWEHHSNSDKMIWQEYAENIYMLKEDAQRIILMIKKAQQNNCVIKPINGIEYEEDERLVKDVNDSDIEYNNHFVYKRKPQNKKELLIKGEGKIYPRDRQVAVNALAHAKFLCEYNILHESFIKKNTNRKYMEPHHLVPLSASHLFKCSLDVEENIVSLCSECHNRIHYGRDAKELIICLYNVRKEYLADVGIDITIEELLELYGWY